MDVPQAASAHAISTFDIFFVADRVAAKEVTIEYCPTGDMIADYFTKPLQGSLFKKFRDQIMNIDQSKLPAPAPKSVQDPRSVLKHVLLNLNKITPVLTSVHDHTPDEWTVVASRKKRRPTKVVTWKAKLVTQYTY